VISITDGQIFLESDLFYAGIRPALNVGLSVSRVGGDAQTKAMKRVAGKLRIDLAQYRELAAFAQFGTDLDKATKSQLDRGARITELLKQPQYVPMPLSRQVAIMFAVTNGYVDDVALDKVKPFESGLLQFLETNYPEVLLTIDNEKALNESIEERLANAIQEFKKTVPF
jgi:F-type H+-transporting ATPase subunit alpha